MSSLAIQRIFTLQREAKNGQQIAQVLHSEGFSIVETHVAFVQTGYVVSIEKLPDSLVLHISEQPMEQVEIMTPKVDPNSLPSVYWN